MTAERESMTLQEMDAPALGVEERRDEAPRAGAGHARPTPDPEVVAKPKRRKFTAQYRLRILEEAESCRQPGEVGRLLRREGLYSSHLTEWRRARREGSLQGLTPSKRGRKPAERNPLSAKVHKLEAKVARLEKELHTAHTILDVQGKSCRAAGIQPRTREGLLMAVQPLASQVGVAPACRALGVPRASFYRRQRPAPGHQQPRPTPARALCASERAHVLDVLASPRFVDRSPAEVVATLLDEGRYLCAERTMYRILAANQPVRERRNQRSHPCYTKPELVATGPNQTWSWDITRLRGPKRWTSFYLYVLLDIFSRYVVGWMVADRENAALAATLIEETCLKQGIEPQVLTLHSDRGAPMTSKCTAQLLADLGVTRSLSRPQVSDDNPFSEAQFKTLKYHPGFPGRFEDITAAIAFCRSFFPWYNTEHRHAGIAMLTPDDVHLLVPTVNLPFVPTQNCSLFGLSMTAHRVAMLALPTERERCADVRMGDQDVVEALLGAGRLEGGAVAAVRGEPSNDPLLDRDGPTGPGSVGRCERVCAASASGAQAGPLQGDHRRAP